VSKGLTGDAGGPGVAVVVAVLGLDDDLRAQGGRSVCARTLLTPKKTASRHGSEAKRTGEGVGRIRILRCSFRDGGIEWRGRQFAIGPDGAVFEIFLFPDGDGALQGVDGEAAGFECGWAMRSADGDEHAGFADFQAAQAVGDGYAVDGEFFVDGGRDFADFGQGHRLVGFVIEIKSAAAVGLVADASVKSDDGTVAGHADMVDQGGAVDRLANQLEQIFGGLRSGHGEWISRR
jgi:hypothetical protein